MILKLYDWLCPHFANKGTFVARNAPHLPTAPAIQIAARIATWFAGGIILAICMRLTSAMLPGSTAVRVPAWWICGLAFIGVEMIAHLALQLRGRPSFYNARG